MEDCVYKDKVKGLSWSRNDGTTRDWETAITFCAGLNYGGYSSGWRLPMQKEMMQAYIDGINYLDSSTKLNVGQCCDYWTSTTSSDVFTQATVVNPHDAYSFHPDKTTAEPVICVR